MEDSDNKRRRIVIDDDDDDEVDNNEEDKISNPDEYLDQNNEEEDEGEDLNENWMDDYAPAPELDYYDTSVLAKDDEEELFESYEKRVRDRLAAEEELDAMDMKRKQRDLQMETNLERVNRSEQAELDEDDEEQEEEEEMGLDGSDKALNLEAFECPLKEWIAEERTRREIARRFRKFLLTYYPGNYEYYQIIISY